MDVVASALLFGWKPVAAAFVLSLLINLIPGALVRRRALLGLAALPILLFVAVALAADCLPGAGKPQCAVIGWGLTLLPIQWLLWVAALAGGTAVRRLAAQREFR